MKTFVSCLALKYAEFHGYQCGFIICFIGLRVYEILLQMFRGGGGTFFLGYGYFIVVIMYKYCFQFIDCIPD